MSSHAIDRSHSALILVDIQYDFLPGGHLAVADGDAILAPVDALMRSQTFGLMLATQDWHPPGHLSFASSHPGRAPFEAITLHGHEQVLWPDHCIAGSPGAALQRDLAWDRVEAIFRKGTDPRVDSYSGFRNNWNADGERPSTGLDGFLRSRDVTEVYVVGLARDYCVKWTAEDSADAGFRTFVLWDLTRPVDAAADATVRAELVDRGVGVLDASMITAR